MTTEPFSHSVPLPRLVHPALDTEPCRSLDAAIGESGAPRLTDRRRVGLLLQGAALLAHLDSAGGRTARGWRGAGLSPSGELCGVEAVPGPRRVLCQESLRELVERLFGSPERVAGRGAARRAVRRLLERWRPVLAPLPPHRAVTEILEVAPFLWERDHGVDRRALVAELVRNGSATVLVAGAGTGGWPRRVPADDPDALRELLAGEDARRLWRGGDDAPSDPSVPAAAGRWRAAVAAWAIRGTDGPGERLAHGEALLADGRFAAAAEVLKELEGGRALAGHLRARLLLGELGPVRRRLARLPEDADLPADALVELADVAQRAFGNSKHPERARSWIERALGVAREAGGEAAALAEVVAATAAWDRGDGEAMDHHLTSARNAAGPAAPAGKMSPRVAWRWRQAAGLRAMAEGDGPAIVESLSRALATARRTLRRDQAGGLWSDLGVGRARVGDLAGAERAFLHAHRLLAACDGPRRTTLALHNLAEIRLRRGRLAGVEGILARALEENRLAGNVRGQIHDLALLARHELVLGRPRSALSHVDEARELQGGADGWFRDELSLLEARAQGWLGRPEEAAAALDGIGPEALAELEPEERPALFALAGLPERAGCLVEEGEAALPDGLAALWRAALDGDAAPGPLWRALDELEPYRAARTVLDLERVRPGIAPASWRRRAVAVLRRVGAAAFAEHLELSDGGAWTALGRFLSPAGGSSGDGGGSSDPPGLPALRRLFEEAGYPEIRVERWSEDHPTGPEVLIGGEGGGEELSAPDRRGGRLVLRAATLGPTVRALFALAVREIAGGPAGSEPGPPAARSADRSTARGGIVGESPALQAAVERAGLLSTGDLPILVQGESGTGKELIARLVHRESRRRGELVAVNCAALSENLLLSDLFGHVRGAFTGADRERAGVFESAAGGTVFLDEIGDLPLAAQGTLLRVLQEGEVRRLGESLPRKVDARLVAATHRDLSAMVAAGSFRRDLFFRLSVARVELPPLRERDGDALRIADALLAELAPGSRLTAAARGRLAAHPWPGNVRELRNVLEVAVALSGAGAGAGAGEATRAIAPEHLELEPSADRKADRKEEGEPAGDYHARIEAYRIRLVREALAASGGNRAEAARTLGVSRQALSYLVKQLRLV